MRVSLVLTIIGAERPGIVAEVATLAAAHDASWQDSRMARLAGQFAGIVALEVSEEESAALERALQTLESEGLQIAIGRAARRDRPRRLARGSRDDRGRADGGPEPRPRAARRRLMRPAGGASVDAITSDVLDG
jgi:predicted amino acid-binding ACT domain protein